MVVQLTVQLHEAELRHADNGVKEKQQAEQDSQGRNRWDGFKQSHENNLNGLHTFGQSKHTSNSECACNHAQDTHIKRQVELQDDNDEPREDNHSEIELVPGVTEVVFTVRGDLHDRFNSENRTESVVYNF